MNIEAIFAGTQNDSFARSYALINPSFRVDSFTRDTPFVKKLKTVYEKAGVSTSEAVFFIEQVTGHLIPDFKLALTDAL